MPHAAHPHAPEHETIKETIESIVIAFIMAFVFRAFIVEPFIIPTGSMAPTLLGEHLSVTCSQCGYSCNIDPALRSSENAKMPERLPYQRFAVCPMCHFPQPLMPGTRIGAGDRILVLKPIYTIGQPKRWDVVVFKAPHAPENNYIKRLVGLPDEELLITEGNVYAKPLGKDDTFWRIQRKSDRPDVQRVLWQPIYHSQFVPLDQGNPRISPQRTITNDSNRQRIELDWSCPWKTSDPTAKWTLENQRSYRCESEQPSAIVFDYARQFRTSPRYVYNQFGKRLPWESDRFFDTQPIEDIRLSAVVQPDRSGLTLELSTTGRWADLDQYQPVMLSAQWNAQGAIRLLATTRDGQEHSLAESKKTFPLKNHEARSIELWLVDQELSFWLDGQKILTAQYDLSYEALRERSALPEDYFPKTQIKVQGSPVTLHQVELDRDLFYASQGSPAMPPARSAWLKRPDGSVYGQPVILTHDQFFCCGDNSPNSFDSRLMMDVEPWYWQQYWHDRPSEEVLGRVPRDMMMGRAFLVYWPAMYSTSPQSVAFIPNFADMRFIR